MKVSVKLTGVPIFVGFVSDCHRSAFALNAKATTFK